MSTKLDEIRTLAENDLLTFIRLVAPHRVLGAIHEEVLAWESAQDRKDHTLLLLPRAHQKSMLRAYRVAWEITRNPAITLLYLSSTSNLAEKQLKAIQDVLTSPIYTRYWPEMVNQQEGKREKWTSTEIAVDHPLRKQEGVRDATVFTGGLTTSLTGLHCDLTVLDDVVVYENAYTEEGRRKVRSQYSLLSSIENPGARQLVAGTRYHPRDLYNDLMDMKEEVYDPETGELVDERPVYDVMQREVEDRGDGTGEYLWPRQRRKDGKWFGFDASILSKKKAQYLDKTQFYAQYYNNPNDPSSSEIDSDRFQYYNKAKLREENGDWYYGDSKLNVFASIDFAFSLQNKADYTAIVVIGIDAYKNIYILQIDRFKTNKIKEYFRHILDAHVYWGFRKLRAEVTAAQVVIVNQLKEEIKENGLAIKVDPYRPTRHEGTKEERVAASLEPRYDSLAIWHYKGGNCQLLEEELTMKRPPHDDIKDALASVIDIAIPPRARSFNANNVSQINFHPRFGGIR